MAVVHAAPAPRPLVHPPRPSARAVRQDGPVRNAGVAEAAVLAAERQVLASRGAPQSWAALSRAHEAAGHLERALAACETGLGLHPHDRPLALLKAEVLIAANRWPAARRVWEALLAQGADAVVRLGLARTAAEMGDWDAVDEQLAALGAAALRGPEAGWIAARLELARGRPEAAAAGLIGLADDPRLGTAQRADLQLLLSEALHEAGRFVEAFEAAARGKGLQRGLYAEAAAAREPIADRYRRLNTWFETRPPARPATDHDRVSPARAHVFLVGFPRSGTTLLEQALAGHPEVAALEEAPTLAEAHDRFLASDTGLRALATLSAADADYWRRRYWSEVAAQGVVADGRLFLDKAPAATDDLPLIARLFPAAKVLFAVRDPRDVVLSCLRRNFRMNALTYAFTDLTAAAEAYAAGMALSETYRRVLPLDLLEVRHEALVEDPEGGLRDVCRFLGLDFRPAMLDVGATARARVIRTPSAAQVRAGLNRRGVGQWRAYAEALAPVAPTLAPWIDRFGYPAA